MKNNLSKINKNIQKQYSQPNKKVLQNRISYHRYEIAFLSNSIFHKIIHQPTKIHTREYSNSRRNRHATYVTISTQTITIIEMKCTNEASN